MRCALSLSPISAPFALPSLQFLPHLRYHLSNFAPICATISPIAPPFPLPSLQFLPHFLYHLSNFSPICATTSPIFPPFALPPLYFSPFALPSLQFLPHLRYHLSNFFPRWQINSNLTSGFPGKILAIFCCCGTTACRLFTNWRHDRTSCRAPTEARTAFRCTCGDFADTN